MLRFDHARSLREFKRAVHFFDVGSQNWGVADTRGNIAYWTGAEAPLREDLQSGTVAGLPPSLVRDGTGALPNGWIPDPHRPAPDQALPYKILPFEEMPQLVNPRQGFIATANNDPIGVSLDNDPLNQRRPGGGIYYLSSLYANGSRVGRITRLLQAELARHGRVSRAAMARIQSDVTLVDAQVLEPFIQRAYRNAATPGAPPQLAALAADPALGEAVQRLRAWDASTPTGSPRATTPATSAASGARRAARRSPAASPPRSTRCGAAGSSPTRSARRSNASGWRRTRRATTRATTRRWLRCATCSTRSRPHTASAPRG